MSTPNRPLKILFVEDSPADATLVLREVKRAGFVFEHHLCDTESDFRAHLNPDLDVIISDYNLPQFSAPRAIELLQESGLDVPLIVVSGSVGEDVAADLIKRGAVDYLLKDRLARLGAAIAHAQEQRRLRTEGKRLEEQLRQTLKMHALGQLAGGIAHDFNNILTVILGYSDALLNEPLEAEAARGMIEEIRDAGQRAATLTRQLLAFSRKQVLEPHRLSLNVVVQNVMSMLKRLLGANIQLAAELDPALAQVRADPGQLEQVVVNLAVNARDAMPQGGTLRLQTKNVELEADECGPELRPGPYAALLVSDTGSGMSPETIARVCEPFFTTKAQGKGTGLGLSTVHGIVTQSGGALRIDSTVGVGSCFTVLLPAISTHDGAALGTTASAAAG